MAYSSLQLLTDRYGERTLVALTDRAYPATGVLDLAVVTRALTDTDAMIDGYLAVRHALPLASVPALIADLAGSITLYKLHVAAPDPKVQADYDQALRMLKDISRGDVRLSVAGIEPVAPGTGSGVRVTDRERPMTAENLKGFI